MPKFLPALLLGCLASLPHCLARAQTMLLADAVLPDAPAAPEQLPGTISGTVVDQNGNFLVAAQVTLVHPEAQGQLETQETKSDQEGQFLFLRVPPGPFQLMVASPGFGNREVPGVLHAGDALVIPQIDLPIAIASTEVRIDVSNYDLSEEQVKIEEHQRVLGVVPNYFVTYQRDSLPLARRQKFELALKTTLDPVVFGAAATIAGIEQARNDYRGYGQGAKGYFNRFGASYGDAFIGIMIGSAVLPSVFKQDPRYFYKGNGSVSARTLYALANGVICKGDNGRWQLNYSGILGSLASGGISNLYYPASSRNGATLTFQNTLIGIGSSAIGNIFQEFLVRKLTPHAQGKP